MIEITIKGDTNEVEDFISLVNSTTVSGDTLKIFEAYKIELKEISYTLSDNKVEKIAEIKQINIKTDEMFGGENYE